MQERDMLKNVMCAGLLMAAASAGSAQLTEISFDRFVQSGVVGGADSDPVSTITGPMSGAWNIDHFSSAVDDMNGGSASGYQDSDIGVGAYSGYVDAASSAFGDGADFANAFALSHYEFDFLLSGTEDYTLDGFVNAFGEINGEVSEADIRLVDLSDNSLIHNWSISNGFEAFDVAGSLPAGSYRFVAEAYTIVNRDFVNGFGDSTATVNFEMTLTPAPHAVAVLGLAGLGCSIRRRR